MAKLKSRDMLVVLTDDDGNDVEHQVTLRLVDQVRAELEGKANGIDAVKMPLHLQGLFAWAACTRLGLFTGRWQAFLEACASVEDVADSEVDVPPTTPPAPSA